jgi:hypothetical protein
VFFNPAFLGLKVGTTDYDQKLVLGEYDFKTSGDKRIKFVCTRVAGLALDNLVLRPVY